MIVQIWQHNVLIAAIHLSQDRTSKGPLTDVELAMAGLSATAFKQENVIEAGYYYVVLTDETGYEYDSRQQTV